MPPFQRLVRHTIGEAHGALHHLNGPRDLDVCSDSLGMKRDARFPFEVAMDEGFNNSWFVAPCQFDFDMHSIWQWRCHHAVQHCAREQGVSSFESKLL